MAGIGFELRKFLSKNNYTGLLGAYGYAGLVASGPWLLAILTILVLSLFAKWHHVSFDIAHQFQVIVVYLIAGSLIFSSVFQHTYTRYIADEGFLNRQNQLVPSLNSLYSFVMGVGGVSAAILTHFLLPDVHEELKLIIISSFIILSMVWVTTSVLSGLLAYKTIFVAFLSNFLLAILLGYFLHTYGLRGLLLSFLSGQFLLLMILIYAIYRFYPTEELVNYDFFRLKNTKHALFFTGLFYNIGIWIDKFIFWYSPVTGSTVIGGLNESIVYDTPIFLAYLAVVPGMTIFLLHMETEYEDAHINLYKKINAQSTLAGIQGAYRRLLFAGKTAIYGVTKAETYILVLGVTAVSAFFVWLGISTAYFPLFCICLLGATLNVIFWAALDIVFYLDKINHALFLTFFFMISNAFFTWLSIKLGFYYYGYGLVASLLTTVIFSFLLLNHAFNNLQYETYMLQ